MRGGPDLGHVHVPQLVRAGDPGVAGPASPVELADGLQQSMLGASPAARVCGSPPHRARVSQAQRPSGCHRSGSPSRPRDPCVTRPATPRPRRGGPCRDRPVERLTRDPRHACDDGWFCGPVANTARALDTRTLKSSPARVAPRTPVRRSCGRAPLELADASSLRAARPLPGQRSRHVVSPGRSCRHRAADHATGSRASRRSRTRDTHHDIAITTQPGKDDLEFLLRGETSGTSSSGSSSTSRI